MKKNEQCPSLTFRQSTPEDRDFLWSLKVQSMGPYIEKIFGWDESVQLKFFNNGFMPEKISIVRYKEQDAGMYELEELQDSWLLSRIEILPDFQNRGIGCRVLERIIVETGFSGKPLKLQVFKINPARNLYERLGFKIYGETDNHYKMFLGASY